MARSKKATPAQRAKARRDPAIFRPPPAIRGDRSSSLQNLYLRVGGRAYPISGHIEADTPWSMGVDQAGTFSLALRDPTHSFRRILTDEMLLQRDGVRVTLDGVVYCVDGVDHDGEGLYTLTMIDEVQWRLRAFSSFKSASRARTTRFGFIYGFVREASRSPLPPMRSFIPEVDDKQPIRKPPPTNAAGG